MSGLIVGQYRCNNCGRELKPGEACSFCFAPDVSCLRPDPTFLDRECIRLKAENARLREGLESAQDSYASECIASHEWESLYNQAQREVIQLRAQRAALREALAEAGTVLEVYATNHSVIDKIDATLESTKE